MTRRLVMFAVALALWSVADAGAQSSAQKAAKAPPLHETTLHIYLAKGEANACGEGCSEWIAVEGRFDPAAAGRVQAFLKRHGARKLPVYFQSPGGSATAAMAIGRSLRERGLTVGVGKTVPSACASATDRSDACRAAKRSAQPVTAAWQPDASCNSACVFALLGGKVRHVPPSARLGVHSGKITFFRKTSDGRVQQLTAKDMPALHKTRMAEVDGQLRRYIRDMGIDGKLFETAAKVPHEDIYYLSRDEIAAYGIDRRAHSETPWFVAQMANKTMYVSKWIVEARGPDRKDYRVSIVLLSCLQPQRATILYLRGLASDEVGRSVTATFAIGKHRATFAFKGDGKKQDAIDTGALFLSSLATVPFDEIEAAVAHGAIGIVETHALAAREGSGPRAIELQTDGLAEGIKTLRDKCVQPAQPVSNWADGMRAPWGGSTQAPPSFPATPYGAFPAPELGLEKKKKTTK